MIIGDQEYSEIIVTDNEGGVLVSITDENLIVEDTCKVMCMPIEN